MMREEWNFILAEIYRESRSLPFWENVFNLHDAEDQNYFLMLDEMTGRK